MSQRERQQSTGISNMTLLPLPPRRRQGKLSPFVLAAITGAGLAMFLAVGMLVRGRASDAREKTEPGLSYTNERVARVPWSIHVLKIDRSRRDLTFFSAHARGKVLGVSLIADQARAVPREIGRALAGVNGDFYVRDNPTCAG